MQDVLHIIYWQGSQPILWFYIKQEYLNLVGTHKDQLPYWLIKLILTFNAARRLPWMRLLKNGIFSVSEV